MLRSFYRFQNNSRKNLILKYCRSRDCRLRGCSSKLNQLNLIDQLEDKKFKAIELDSNQPKNESIKLTSNKLTDNLNKCENLVSLLQFVELNLFKFTTDQQLILVYTKLNSLISQLNKTKELNKNLDQSYRMVKTSSSFKLLLNRTNDSFKNLKTNDLLTVFQTFQLVNLTQQNENFIQLIELLRNRFNKNKLTGITDLNDEVYCLKIIIYYLFKSNASDQLLKLQNELLEMVRSKLLADEFNQTDIFLLANLFFIFLSPENDPNYEITIKLTKLLLSTEIQLDFKQSVDLLHKLKINYSFTMQRLRKGYYADKELSSRLRRTELYPKIIGKLIDKCNLIIHQTLNKEPTNENFMFYLIKLDKSTENISKQFDNFYDQTLLHSLLTPFCLQNFESNARIKYLFYDLVRNYSRINVYDERLLKFIYDLYYSNPHLRMNLDICEFYYLFTKLRLPFVDRQNFAINLFNFSDQFYSAMDRTRFNRLKVLTRLIINDVYDEQLYLYFDETLNFLDFKIYEQMNQRLYNQTSLARAYLSMFSEMNNSLKQRILTKLDRTINECPLIHNVHNNITDVRLSNINNKLQSNNYLSNGIYVDVFAIYDRSKNDLISLDQFKNYCFRIDQIPLNKNQQLIVFITSNRIKGYIKQYEHNYSYQLKRVLNHLKIKPIEVYREDLQNLRLVSKEDFLIKKALDHCHNL